ncbi:hypothetical protein [Janthinobacterium sp. PSPC3-1]|uniref:hypothetical protein n=1 Tax=Janthinobacterium sp. PSPC3-1 TaxID=2804653 RepID=UPI003CE70943
MSNLAMYALLAGLLGLCCLWTAWLEHQHGTRSSFGFMRVLAVLLLLGSVALALLDFLAAK